MNLFGEHIDRLALLASDVEQRLAAIEGIEDAKSSVGSSRQEIQVSLNQELAANYGVSPETLSQTFAFTLGGRRLRRYNAGDKEVELLLMMSQQDVSTLDDLKSFVVSGEDGRGVTLGTLAEFRVVDKPKTIERENRKTQVSIRSSYEGEDWDGAREQIEEGLNGMAFPVGYSWSFGERIQEQDRQLEQMIVNYLLALALIYIVMASQFESLVHPFAILFSIPFASWGVTWFLLVTHTPLNFMVQIGLLVLMGIVVKNGIVLIDHINNLRREGYDRETAIEPRRQGAPAPDPHDSRHRCTRSRSDGDRSDRAHGALLLSARPNGHRRLDGVDVLDPRHLAVHLRALRQRRCLVWQSVARSAQARRWPIRRGIDPASSLKA